MNGELDEAGPWKKGFEIELLAPKGSSRRDLADRIAEHVDGRVRTCFYPQSEPSLVPNLPVFENLILGFDVLDTQGERVALIVDDLTIQADLDRHAPPKDGWLRILSDDARLLSLIQKHCSADAALDEVLTPIAQLFGTRVQQPDPQVFKVDDAYGRSIAMATTLPGERERPCEIITAPINGDAKDALAPLIEDAHALGFTVPAEAAVHVHFDGAALCSAPVLSRLINALHHYRTQLSDRVRTNPACVRLGPTPQSILNLIKSQEFLDANWSDARSMLAKLKPSKYCDLNISNLVFDVQHKHTFEARIFPGSLSVDEIVSNAAMFESILNWAVTDRDFDSREQLDMFLSAIGAD